MDSILDYYQDELDKDSTNYFIFDTVGLGDHGDVEFETYDWSTNMFNRVKPGDLFIYRRPAKASEVKNKFYFFGAGKIDSITNLEGKRVRGNITKALVFEKQLLQDDLNDFEWRFKQRSNTWEHFFNQYGMNCINKEDFLNLLMLSNADMNDIDNDSIKDEVEMLQQMERGDYSVDDYVGKQKIRKGQKVFADKVKLVYQNTCAITGVNTRDFLVASHIIPWAADKKHRLDPRNGICLSVLVDKAFDKGYISIDEKYKVILSKHLVQDNILYNELKKFEGKKIKLVKGYEPKQEFLEWHREHILKK